jgi:hypothetical protein
LKTFANGFLISFAKGLEKHIVNRIGTPKATRANIAPGK